jgi:RNA 3'-terminal phosphate cyclase (ATP)
VRGGDHVFAVGSAGSAGLVLQTVLPPLLASGQAARLRLEGGTHNPAAPPFDFLERVFAPVLARMGAELTLCLERWGFYPAGGGAFTVEIGPCGGLRGVEMTGRGEILRRRARAVVAHLRPDIARRELEVVRGELGFADDELEIRQVRESDGPGNVLLVELEGDGFRELVSAFGERGVSAESVARRAVDAARAYASADAPIGVALADQLLLPFALAGEGVFRTVSLSEHTRTNLEIVREFLPVRIEAYEESDGARVAFHS